jgi:hypothetical protein
VYFIEILTEPVGINGKIIKKIGNKINGAIINSRNFYII